MEALRLKHNRLFFRDETNRKESSLRKSVLKLTQRETRDALIIISYRRNINSTAKEASSVRALGTRVKEELVLLITDVLLCT